MGTMCHPIAAQIFSKLCFKALKRKALTAHPSIIALGLTAFLLLYIAIPPSA